MGLGTVLSVDQRSVRILFMASGETRTYARHSAPLTRLVFSAGDTVKSHAGQSLVIEQVIEDDGLLTYLGRDTQGQPAQIQEGELDNFMQLSQPGDRLLNGQLDKPRWFELRHQTRQYQNQLSQSRLYGLIGARTSLLPHQLYIASEVAQRYAPRVLLADEVGLGKTIEAGLILHQQLLTERAQRILIVVPESLLHQWLVEMVRRFNLYFSVFDEARITAIIEQDESQNPFVTEQLVLCSLEFLTAQEETFQHALQGEWDMLIVDEAHHLQWNPQQTSHEYRCIEQLAQATAGVLLLTATPEQLGRHGHFARLRLLDPDRFVDYPRFIAEEEQYAPLANAIDNLLAASPLTEQNRQQLEGHLAEADNVALLDRLERDDISTTEQQKARDELIEHLLDRHGTGRVLFRNTRHAIKGFPQRQLQAWPLGLPQAYRAVLQHNQALAVDDVQHLLCPERLYQSEKATDDTDWWHIDPRASWLAEKLRELKPAKALVIAASAITALELSEYLQNRHGIHAAVFHEGLSILERDRAAAFFADHEVGSQVLICSEIGSEGRNFQFAHHLILFDLPLNPDLLEQRIGRLDRIGQQETIRIHVPYLDNSPQAIMKHWYHEGLNAFEQTCTAGQQVFRDMGDDLIRTLQQLDDGLEHLPELVDASRARYEEYSTALQQGRDRLLELSSYREERALRLVELARRQTREHELNHFLDAVFDNYGIEIEARSTTSYVIHPGDHVRISLPGLSEDGMTITYDRDTALSNEDVHYLSWEHPLVATAIDTILSSESGNTAMVAIKYPAITAGTLLIECFYLLESAAGQQLNMSRYLPANNIRVVIDQTGKQYQNILSHEQINQHQQRIKHDTAIQITRVHGATLKKMIAVCDKLASNSTPRLLDDAKQHAAELLQNEILRLQAMQNINPNIRPEEIEHFTNLQNQINQRLDQTVAQLDAIRVIIAT